MPSFSRVSYNMQINTIMKNVNTTTSNILNVQAQLASGRRINLPSDDPAGTTVVLSLQNLYERKIQYVRNVEIAWNRLSISDTALRDGNDLATSAYTTALDQLNATATQSTREIAGHTVTENIKEMINIANRMFGSRYIFAGQNVLTAPFELRSDGVLYTGDIFPIQVHIDEATRGLVEVNGREAFMAMTATVDGRTNLGPRLNLAQGETVLADLNNGEGIPAGEIEVTIDGGLTWTRVDLTSVKSLDNVKSAIEDKVAGVSVGLRLDHRGLMLSTVNPADQLQVREVADNNVAYSLGILSSQDTDPATNVIAGADLQRRLTDHTLMSDISIAGTGQSIAVSTDGGATFTNVDLSAANTIQDIVNAIQGATAAAVTIGGSGANLRLTGPGGVVVQEVGEGHTAYALGLLPAQDSDPGNTLEGADLRLPALALTDGAGAAYLGASTANIRIRNGNESAIISLSQANRVQDLVNFVENSGTNTVLLIDGKNNSLDFFSRMNGAQLYVEDVNDGVGIASALGFTNFHGGLSLDALNRGLGVNYSDRTYDFDVTVGAATFAVAVAAPSLSELGNGTGVPTDGGAGNDINIDFGGVVVGFDLDAYSTVEGLVRAINAAAPAGFGAVYDNNAIRLEGDGVGQISVTNVNPFIFAAEAIGFQSGVVSTNFELDGGKLGVRQYISVQDVIDRIEAVAADAGIANVSGRVYQNGIELSAGGAALTLTQRPGNETLRDLGLPDDGTVYPGGVILGANVGPMQTDSVFTGMVNLKNALFANDTEAISVAAEQLQDGQKLLLDARAMIGARSKRMEIAKQRIESEIVELQDLTSRHLDADFAEVAILFQQYQQSFLAAIRAASNIMQTSLLDFI